MNLKKISERAKRRLKEESKVSSGNVRQRFLDEVVREIEHRRKKLRPEVFRPT